MVSLKDAFAGSHSQLEDFLSIIYYCIDSTWCMVMTQIQFSLIKRIKIGRPEHSLPSPPTFANISFWPYRSPTPYPLQSGRHMCITLSVKLRYFTQRFPNKHNMKINSKRLKQYVRFPYSYQKITRMASCQLYGSCRHLLVQSQWWKHRSNV